MFRFRLVLFIVLVLVVCSVQAEVTLPSLISDHMVLQRDIKVSIWGWGDPGEKVRVSFRGQEVTSQADSWGNWGISLQPMAAGGPFEMIVQGQNKIVIQDVLVGEVWVGSGQSNMQWSVRRSANAEKEIASADFPHLRLFSVPRKVADSPQKDVDGSWTSVTPETIPEFSAVSYFFGRELHKKMGIPVGLVHSSWGGTPAESWTSHEALMANPSLHRIVWKWKEVLMGYPFELVDYEESLQEWEKEAAKARQEGRPEPRKPRGPRGPGSSWTPSGLFNAMIAPLTSYAIRGVIWYQGESNAQPYRSIEYRQLFPTMIHDWRRAWDQGPFPFLFVQLANYRERQSEPVESPWAEVQEAQRMTLALANTGMAVIIDIGEADDIHPRNKQDVGLRLSLAARGIAYGEDIVYSGPLYKGMIIEGNRIRVRFDHVGGGLKSRSGALRGFAVAGRDREFKWARAQIDGDTVVVSNPEVASPVAVRYAWQDNPEASLYNEEGLPASPFRTDDWSELNR
jgi:sialate O-acetylesterase